MKSERVRDGVWRKNRGQEVRQSEHLDGRLCKRQWLEHNGGVDRAIAWPTQT